MERECNKCIHHISGACSSFDCKMQTVEDVKKEAKKKAIEEFADRLVRASKFYLIGGYMLPIVKIKQIADELKGEPDAKEKQTSPCP